MPGERSTQKIVADEVDATGDADSKCEKLNPDYQGSVALTIAFVPDPNETRLRLQFDRSMNALIWAAQDAGKYSLRDFWLPWKVTASPPFATFDDRKAEDDEKAKDKKRPGLLVFTKPEGTLAVLLVGESAVKGPNPDQFKAGLRLAAQVARLSNSNESALNVIGPCFSGSFGWFKSEAELEDLERLAGWPHRLNYI